MKRAQTLLKRLLHPPKWVLLTLPPIVFAALTDVLLNGKNSMPAYMIYCMSAYCLTIWVLPLPRLFRKVKANMIRRLAGTVFGEKYIGDLAFRRRMNAITGGGVWFSVILIAVYMLLRSRNMKEVKSFEPLGE